MIPGATTQRQGRASGRATTQRVMPKRRGPGDAVARLQAKVDALEVIILEIGAAAAEVAGDEGHDGG